jgi:hypothetical protein
MILPGHSPFFSQKRRFHFRNQQNPIAMGLLPKSAHFFGEGPDMIQELIWEFWNWD